MRSTLLLLRRATFLLLVAACGARSGLFADEGLNAGFTDGGTDSSIPPDATIVFDDGGSTLDVRPPTDVNRTDCPDADSLLVYTMTDTNELQSFNPSTGQFRLITRIACPTTATDTPFSMAVDRRGIAYVLFSQSHRIFRVSTATGACVATSFTPDQHNFQLFGMGFATNAGGPSETLYVAGDTNQQGGTGGLASIDTTTFRLSVINDFNTVASAELTGTGDGRLFGFYRKGQNSPPSFIGQLSTDNGSVLGERQFSTVDQGTGWAFAYWGGDFYMFHAPGGQTVVTRWRPGDDTLVDVASTSLKIVGAGVSTCAPQQ